MIIFTAAESLNPAYMVIGLLSMLRLVRYVSRSTRKGTSKVHGSKISQRHFLKSEL